MFRRINLMAGPGVGKSTMAAWLYSSLKAEGRSVELVREHVKNWVYEDRPPKSFDQIFLFAAQMRAEDVILRSGVELVITDSPLFLSTCYSEKYGTPGWRNLLALCDEFDAAYPALDVLMRRQTKYEASGRFHGEAEALEMDAFIKTRMTSRGKSFHEAETGNEVLEIIRDQTTR